MKQIAESFTKSPEEKNSCTLCNGKIEPDDRNKVVSGEYTKSLLKEDDRENLKAWIDAVTRYSQQLREALLSSESFVRRMLEIHKELHNYDMKRDNGIIVSKLQDMRNLAMMSETDMKLIARTLEQIEGKVHGNA
jgi:hypothetical protein